MPPHRGKRKPSELLPKPTKKAKISKARGKALKEELDGDVGSVYVIKPGKREGPKASAAVVKGGLGSTEDVRTALQTVMKGMDKL